MADEPEVEHGIFDYVPFFKLFSCRCGEKFETAGDLGEHVGIWS